MVKAILRLTIKNNNIKDTSRTVTYMGMSVYEKIFNILKDGKRGGKTEINV